MKRTAPLALWLALALSLYALPAHADVAAVLMVEDEGYGRSAITERVGASLYSSFLKEGPYARILLVRGRQRGQERLAAAIRHLAARHDAVDVFLSVHTTTRDVTRWQGLIPPEARKLRLVYSTACYGNDAERATWEALGARTVVTHVGINNPLLSAPYVLSRWLSGEAIGSAVSEAWEETSLMASFGLSLPGAPTEAELARDDADFVNGSRPVISGDRELRITAGLPGHTPRVSKELRYARGLGGPLGLMMRAMAGQVAVEGEEAHALLSETDLGVLPIPADELDKVQWVGIHWKTPPTAVDAERFPALAERRPTARAQLVISLSEPITIPLDYGFELRLNETVVIRPGVFDVGRRRLKMSTRGVWVQRGILRISVDSLALSPAKDADEGYQVEATAGLFGLIPIWGSHTIGGSRPDRSEPEAPIFRGGTSAAGEGRATLGASPGLVELVSRWLGNPGD